jgi:hypothetical protein
LYGRVKAKVTIGRDKDLEKMENQVPAWMGTTGWRLFLCSNILHKHGFSNSVNVKNADFRIY